MIGVHIHLLACKPAFMRKNKQTSLREDDLLTLPKLDSVVSGLPGREEELEVSGGSFIEFYKNGKLQHKTFEPIFEGTYHAGVSLYMNAACRVNFGKS